jgi:hypothetical protein
MESSEAWLAVILVLLVLTMAIAILSLVQNKIPGPRGFAGPAGAQGPAGATGSDGGGGGETGLPNLAWCNAYQISNNTYTNGSTIAWNPGGFFFNNSDYFGQSILSKIELKVVGAYLVNSTLFGYLSTAGSPLNYWGAQLTVENGSGSAVYGPFYGGQGEAPGSVNTPLVLRVTEVPATVEWSIVCADEDVVTFTDGFPMNFQNQLFTITYLSENIQLPISPEFQKR